MSDILFNSKTGETWLSNFHLSDIEYDGAIYPSIEHLYQAMKLLPDYPEEAEKIRLARTPSTAKALGNAPFMLPKDWDTRRVEIMRMAVRLKFSPSSELATRLLETGDNKLVEYAPWGDRFWGVDADMVGENMLGKLLMEVRHDLRIREANITHFVRMTVPREGVVQMTAITELDGVHHLGLPFSPIREEIFIRGVEGGSLGRLDAPEMVDPDRSLWIDFDGDIWYALTENPLGDSDRKKVASDPEMIPPMERLIRAYEKAEGPPSDLLLRPY